MTLAQCVNELTEFLLEVPRLKQWLAGRTGTLTFVLRPDHLTTLRWTRVIS